MKTARFVEYPHTISDLKWRSSTCHQFPYKIVGTLTLEPDAYEYFCYHLSEENPFTGGITDLRNKKTCRDSFIESLINSCAEGRLMKCALVRCAYSEDGVLIVPADENKRCIRWAVYVAKMGWAGTGASSAETGCAAGGMDALDRTVRISEETVRTAVRKRGGTPLYECG